MINKITLMLILVGTSLTCSIYAQAYLFNDNTMPEKLIFRADNSQLTATDRQDVARKLINNLNGLDAILPSLSEISMKLLEAQYKSINDHKSLKKSVSDDRAMHEWGKNLRSYYDNPDHDLYELHTKISIAKEYLNCVIEQPEVKKEMLCWTGLSSILISQGWKNNIDDLIDNKKLDNIDVSELGSIKINMLYRMYSNFSEEILDNIVMPYLFDQSIENNLGKHK